MNNNLRGVFRSTPVAAMGHLYRWLVAVLTSVCPIVGVSTIVVANQTVTVLTSVANTLNLMSFRTVRLSGVTGWWRHTTHSINALCYLLDMVWINTRSVVAKVVAFKFGINYTAVQSEAKHVRKNPHASTAHATVTSRRYISTPQPTRSKVRAFWRNRPVLIYVMPEVLGKCQLARCSILYVAKCWHDSIVSHTQSISNNQLLFNV